MRRRPVGSGDRRGPGGSLGVRIRRRMGRLLFQSHAWLGFAACMPVCFAETQFFLKERKKQTNRAAWGVDVSSCLPAGVAWRTLANTCAPFPQSFRPPRLTAQTWRSFHCPRACRYVVAFASRGRRLRPAYCSHRKSRPASPSGPDRGLSGRRPRGPQGSLLAVLVILLGSSWKGGGRSAITSRVPQRASHVFLSSPSFSSSFF